MTKLPSLNEHFELFVQRIVYRFSMFDPSINPYVNKIEEYQDIIWTVCNNSNECIKIKRIDREPIVVDFGCGAGNFLCAYGENNRTHHLFGFELRYKRLVLGARKIKKRSLSNIKLIQDKAENVENWFESDCIDLAFINFPDPWPKKKHHKHRLISNDFMSKLTRLLKVGGSITFKSDHQDYFLFCRDKFEKNPNFEVVEYSDNLHKSDYDKTNFASEFELLFKQKGYPIYFMEIVLQRKNK